MKINKYIDKLENDGYISEYSKKVGKKRTRIYYKLEPEGKQYLDTIRDNYQQVVQGVQAVLCRLDYK